jgi:hypothetical protein
MPDKKQCFHRTNVIGGGIRMQVDSDLGAKIFARVFVS